MTANARSWKTEAVANQEFRVDAGDVDVGLESDVDCIYRYSEASCKRKQNKSPVPMLKYLNVIILIIRSSSNGCWR